MKEAFWQLDHSNSIYLMVMLRAHLAERLRTARRQPGASAAARLHVARAGQRQQQLLFGAGVAASRAEHRVLLVVVVVVVGVVAELLPLLLPSLRHPFLVQRLRVQPRHFVGLATTRRPASAAPSRGAGSPSTRAPAAAAARTHAPFGRLARGRRTAAACPCST